MSVRTVVVAHARTMVAEGLVAGLGAYPEIVPLAAVTTARAAAAFAGRVDAVALDGSLPGATDAADALRRRGTRVVLLDDAPPYGTDGETPEPDDEGVRVSTAVGIGALAAALVPGVWPNPSRTRTLTAREREVLSLASRGLATKQVARSLGISHKTVERHKTRIFAKLGVPNQTAAVRMVMAGIGGTDRGAS